MTATARVPERVAPASAAARAARPARFPCFDGVRAIAATIVLVDHVVLNLRPSWLPKEASLWIARMGNFGVCVFFLISGFLLYRPFVESHFAGRPAPALVPFWKRRAFRIFPAYWVALLVFGLVVVPGTFTNLGNFATLATLTQNYRYGYTGAGLGVAWTLVVEISFYAALPLLALGLRSLVGRDATVRDKLVAQLGGLGAMYVAGNLIRMGSRWYLDRAEPRAYGSWFPLTQLDSWLLGSLDWFALGMALAVVSVWVARGGGVPWVLRVLGDRPAVAWLLALECYWMIVRLNLPATNLVRFTFLQFVVRAFLEGIAAALLLVPAVLGPQDRGGIRRFLRSRVMVFLGTISYGLYLWHAVVYRQVIGWVREGSVPGNFFVIFGIVLALTILAAAASYRFVEKPLIELSHRRSRTGRATTESTTEPATMLSQPGQGGDRPLVP